MYSWAEGLKILNERSNLKREIATLVSEHIRQGISEWGSICDIGCGDGRQLIDLLDEQQANKNIKIALVEPDESLLGKALTKLIELGYKNVEVYSSLDDLTAKPKKQYFSLMLLSHSFYYLSKNDLEIAYDRLELNGLAIIVVKDDSSAINQMKVVMGDYEFTRTSSVRAILINFFDRLLDKKVSSKIVFEIVDNNGNFIQGTKEFDKFLDFVRFSAHVSNSTNNDLIENALQIAKKFHVGRQIEIPLVDRIFLAYKEN